MSQRLAAAKEFCWSSFFLNPSNVRSNKRQVSHFVLEDKSPVIVTLRFNTAIMKASEFRSLLLSKSAYQRSILMLNYQLILGLLSGSFQDISPTNILYAFLPCQPSYSDFTTLKTQTFTKKQVSRYVKFFTRHIMSHSFSYFLPCLPKLHGTESGLRSWKPLTWLINFSYEF